MHLESLEFQKLFYACLTKFKNNQILPNKISHWLLTSTKLFTGSNIPIVILFLILKTFSCLNENNIQVLNFFKSGFCTKIKLHFFYYDLQQPLYFSNYLGNENQMSTAKCHSAECRGTPKIGLEKAEKKDLLRSEL